ncbi:alpha/beta hydrolase-fold protein [Dyadobacter pollutisoli]|uniref:Alpha/beta hydrolase-fold protein n=1 Tax=Dyadobacter pollutisoli TaxID=2910158 RepID=A0A9E8SJL9_9BACT|nr:alpha/beta hydrolase-fold protein [Dyadobacter pollutisoli]WAC11505.1 alpha/beta hydrolase-fold protein [Dyadobacter pollutisoli]
MKTLLLALSLALSFWASAQDKNTISIGKIDSIQSKILGENRKVWVHVPNGGVDGLYGKTRYPVVYLLDGEGHFASVVGMIQQLSSVNGNDICPEMIVVGIPNTDRTRDLTPTHISSDPPFMDTTFSKKTGGGTNFLSFIQKELIPHIDSLYPTQPYKMLIGHSFGGLAVMNSLINRPKLFNSYICIDPSMWYDHMNFLKTTKKALSGQKFSGTSLYLGIANTMSEGMTLAKLSKDTTAMNGHIRSIFELDKHAKANPQNGLRYKSKYYPDDTHSSAPLITEYDALRFIFDYYPLKLTDKDFDDSTVALADKYLKHYAFVSNQMGYKVAPPESAINAMGYQALGSKHFKKAESLFKLNVANYPGSGNVYDSYGDYFVAKKDKINAIAQFEKALSVADNADTRKKLEELRKSTAK